MAEILIVEDEWILAEGLAALFSSAGYSVRRAQTGEEAVSAFEEKLPDVVLLDVMLPAGDGFSVCARMRERNAFVPIVFNTALDRTEDKMRGLALGGDDYVLKTDPPDELLARVARAVLRYRTFRAAYSLRDEIVIGAVAISLSNLEVRGPGDAVHRLTRAEADLLRLLDARRGHLVTTAELLEATCGEGFICDENALYVHLANIRRKLGPARDSLVNERCKGYRLLV